VYERWVRAFLWLEEAQAAPPARRAEVLGMARAARWDHDRIALTYGRYVHKQVLDALFAVRARDAGGALAAARKIEDPGREDALHLYVLALAFESGGDKKRAAELRAKIRERDDTVLKLLVVRRLDADARRPPGAP
jgi:hypothetical protein